MLVFFIVMLFPLSFNFFLYLLLHVRDGLPLHLVSVIKSIKPELLANFYTWNNFYGLIFAGEIVNFDQTEGEFFQGV